MDILKHPGREHDLGIFELESDRLGTNFRKKHKTNTNCRKEPAAFASSFIEGRLAVFVRVLKHISRVTIAKHGTGPSPAKSCLGRGCPLQTPRCKASLAGIHALLGGGNCQIVHRLSSGTYGGYTILSRLCHVRRRIYSNNLVRMRVVT